MRDGSDATDAARNQRVFDSVEVVRDYESMDATTAAEELILGPLLVPGLRVLDLGVGAGRTVPRLSAGAARYVGLDYAPRMIETASARFPDRELVVGDASDLSAYAEESFDLVVFSYNGIDYLPDDATRRRCLAEMRRVLPVGGHLVFSSHNSRAVLRPAEGFDPIRRALVSTYQTARRARHRLGDRSFWRGSGFFLDPVRGGLRTWTSNPEVVRTEATAAGFVHLRTVAGDHPKPARSLVTPWWYYEFEAAAR